MQLWEGRTGSRPSRDTAGELLGEQPQPWVVPARSLHIPLRGWTDTPGQEFCCRKPPAALWIEVILLFYLFPNIPRQRNSPASKEATAYCSRKVTLQLLCPQATTPCIKGTIVSLKKSLNPIHSLEPWQSDLI